MSAKRQSGKKENSQAERPYFKVIAISLPFLLILLLELFLRLISYGGSMNLFVKNDNEGYDEYMMVNPDIGAKYFNKLEYTLPGNDIFLKEKPGGTIRLFVMGSSTVVGFPYENNLMFSRILHKKLEQSYPDHTIEVVNTAITAVNSFTLLDLTDEICKYKPDGVLIYAGHNEYYGAFGAGSREGRSRSRFLTRLHFRMMNVRTYRLLRNTGTALAKNFAGKRDPVHGTLMKRIVSDQDIVYGSEAYQLGIKNFSTNMDAILEKFTREGIPVFISDLISNVKDLPPFNSVKTDTLESAMIVYEQAVAACDSGNFELAAALFYQAKDLDCVRFRASEELNDTIRTLAAKYKVNMIRMQQRFMAESPHGIIGDNLLTEHVHPNIDGIFLMADEFYSGIISSGIFGRKVENQSSLQYDKRNWGYTVLDSLIARHRISNLKHHWPFVAADAEEDYTSSYRPQGKLDQIAFTAMVDPAKRLGDLRLDLAKEYARDGKNYEAYREYEAILRTNPYIAVNYRDAASTLINLGDLPLALSYFERSVHFEESAFAFYRMGEIYVIKGDYSSSISCFEKAFNISTDRNEKIKAMGKMYAACQYTGQKERAEALAFELKKAGANQWLQVPPKQYLYDRYIPFQTRSQVTEASRLASEGRLGEAVELLERSLNVYDSPIAHRYLGEIYYQMKDAGKAKLHFDRVIDEFTFDPKFLSSLILLNITMGNLTQAEAYMNILRTLDPENKSAEMLSLLLQEAKSE